MTPVLDITDVWKSYGDTIALEDVSMSVSAGEVVALVGPNGAGKSTLFSIVAGLSRPDHGHVTIGPASRRGTGVGFAPQDIALHLTLTVRENLTAFAALENLTARGIRQGMRVVEEALDLTDLMHKPVHTLSGGEQRRVHVAVAVLHRPRLLLLDEPTAGVDVRTRRSILELARRAASAGTAVCYSTHYLAEVEQVADRVTMLDHGRVVASGAVAGIIDDACGAVLRFTFAGPPPDLDVPWPTHVGEDSIEIVTDRPAQVAAAVLSALGDDRDRVLSMDVTRPSLETAFLRLAARELAGAQ
jgi:ABC-2 type transport system ATP-binding protein